MQPLYVDPRQLPLLERIAFACQKPAQLFRLRDVEPELNDRHTILNQRVLKTLHLCKEMGPLFSCAETEHMFDHRAIVPRPIEQHHLTRRGQMLDVALKIPLAGLGLGWF